MGASISTARPGVCIDADMFPHIMDAVVAHAAALYDEDGEAGGLLALRATSTEYRDRVNDILHRKLVVRPLEEGARTRKVLGVNREWTAWRRAAAASEVWTAWCDPDSLGKAPWRGACPPASAPRLGAAAGVMVTRPVKASARIPFVMLLASQRVACLQAVCRLSARYK